MLGESHSQRRPSDDSRSELKLLSYFRKISDMLASIFNSFGRDRRDISPNLPTWDDSSTASSHSHNVRVEVRGRDNHLLLVMPYMRRGKIVKQPSCKNLQSDRDLFKIIARQRQENQGHIRKWLSLRTVNDVHFVKFTLLEGDTARVHQLDVLPPEELRDVQYEYQPVDWNPPIDSDQFVHFLEHPWLANGNNYMSRWIPRKLREKLICPNGGYVIGYGIQCKDGVDMARICVLIFGSGLVGLLFSLLWAIFRNDISGGFTAGGTLFIMVTTFVGSLEVFLRDPNKPRTV